MSMRPERDDDVTGASDLNWRVVVGIVAVALAAIFILQNTGDTTIKFLVFDFTVGLWFGLVVTLLLGMVIGWLLSRARAKRKGA